MKKLFALILVLSVCLSLCACSGTPERPDGTPVSTEYREMEFVVYDRDASSDKYGTDYIMELENEEFRVLVKVNVDFYLTYRVGDTVKCEFKPDRDGSSYYRGYLKWKNYEWYVLGTLIF